MFRDSFRDRLGRFIAYRCRHGITIVNLCGRIKYTHGHWCNLVSMEHGSDNSKHNRESRRYYNLFCHGDKFGRLLRNCLRDGVSG